MIPCSAKVRYAFWLLPLTNKYDIQISRVVRRENSLLFGHEQNVILQLSSTDDILMRELLL